MGLFRKIKARAKGSRGGDAPDFVIKQFEENWAAWEANIQTLDDETKNDLIKVFNEISDGLGDALVDTKECFLMTLGDLSAEEL